LKKMEDWRSGLYFFQIKQPYLPEPSLARKGACGGSGAPGMWHTQGS
jgi:hypothetical protein